MTSTASKLLLLASVFGFSAVVLTGCSPDPVDPCPSVSASNCSSDRPYLDYEICACVECTDDHHCSSDSFCDGEDRECVEHGCDDIEPDDCSGDTPVFDAGSCHCVECIDDSDCSEGRCSDSLCEQTNDGGDDKESGESGENGDGENGSDDVECQSNDDCADDENCDLATNDCVPRCELDESTCPVDKPVVDVNYCECVECVVDSDCGASASCADHVCQRECIECSEDEEGICGGDTPYCVEDCCVECLDSSDCEDHQVCSDNFCEPAGSCSGDSDCPTGYECSDDECIYGGPNQPCSEDADCADGEYCDYDDSECRSFAGSGCGHCHDDCTCPEGLSCDTDTNNYLCTGCALFDDDCPDDQSCLPPMDDDESLCMPSDW